MKQEIYRVYRNVTKLNDIRNHWAIEVKRLKKFKGEEGKINPNFEFWASQCKNNSQFKMVKRMEIIK